MKKCFSIYFLLFSLCISTVNAQHFFTKTYTPVLGITTQNIMPNDDIILVGGSYESSDYKIIVNRFNKCGELIWSRSILKKDINLGATDIQIDTNQNIIIVGNYLKNSTDNNPNTDRSIFLMSLSPTGLINYFKMMGAWNIVGEGALKINKLNEVFIYFESLNNAAITLAKFASNGQLQWMKQFDDTKIFGGMCSTSDGGAIISANRSITKVNSKGIVQWTKEFEDSLNTRSIFEIPNGIVIFKDWRYSQTKGYVVLIDHNGKLKWNSQLIPYFQIHSGLLRKNGHLLALGLLSHSSIPYQSIAFVEIDTANGTILKTLVQKEESLPSQAALGFNETSKENILFSGIETFITDKYSTFISKINKQLERVSCQDTLLNFNSPRYTGKIISSPNPWVAQKVNIPILEPLVVVDTFKMTEQQLVCQFSPIMPKLFIDLGNDTLLCTGNSIIIGDTNSRFENYQWLSGATTPTIKIDTTGTYWLKIWNVCDTLTDTINVSFYPKTNFKSSVSTNTAFVNDSIHFQLASPSKFFSLLWNFNDGFQSNIRNPWHVYEKSGTYQPNIFLTDSFGCSYDSTFQLLIQDIPIQVPNVFTPNGDGINDVFEIRGTRFEIQSIKIYDRWGQLTYQTNNTFWDGKTTNGYNARAGTYYYLINYQTTEEKTKTIQGTVMLIR